MNSTPLSRAIAAYRKLDLPATPREEARRVHPKRAKQLSTAELARLVKHYQSGATVYELATEFLINRQTVSRGLKQQGVILRFQTPHRT